MLSGKSCLLGVTGSVAAYRSIDLVRRLKDQGASVQVIMTEASHRFVTPMSLELASGQQVYSDMFSPPFTHLSLPREADIFVTAPASANTLAKYSQGICNDLLSAAFVAFRGPAVVAPAMNWRMWEHPAVQRNLSTIVSMGVSVVPPERGMLACGDEGVGRMASVERIIEDLECLLSPKDLAGERMLVTAGPTREYLDPVRFLSNRSSGKMGYAFAKIARRRGAEVTLISGPACIEAPDVKTLRVETTLEMRDAVMDSLGGVSVVIMTAAVADYSPSCPTAYKKEKEAEISLQLKATTDILAEIGRMEKKPFTVGFAAETGDGADRARQKLSAKNCDMIVLNDVSLVDAGFDVDTNRVVVITRDRFGHLSGHSLPLMHKEEVAAAVLDMIVDARNID